MNSFRRPPDNDRYIPIAPDDPKKVRPSALFKSSATLSDLEPKTKFQYEGMHVIHFINQFMTHTETSRR